jgi:quinol-cytochrome oxidoreductase complex cytochrome b subunit
MGHNENNKGFEVCWAMGILILVFYLSQVVTGALYFKA